MTSLKCLLNKFSVVERKIHRQRRFFGFGAHFLPGFLKDADHFGVRGLLAEFFELAFEKYEAKGMSGDVEQFPAQRCLTRRWRKWGAVVDGILSFSIGDRAGGDKVMG